MSKRQSSRVRCATRLRGAAEEAGASAMLVSLDSRKPRPAQSRAQWHAMDGIWESRKGCGECRGVPRNPGSAEKGAGSPGESREGVQGVPGSPGKEPWLKSIKRFFVWLSHREGGCSSDCVRALLQAQAG